MKKLFLLPTLLLSLISFSSWGSQDKQYACFLEGSQKPYAVTVNTDIWITWEDYPIHYSFLQMLGDTTIYGSFQSDRNFSPEKQYESIFEGDTDIIKKSFDIVTVVFNEKLKKLSVTIMWARKGRADYHAKWSCIPL